MIQLPASTAPPTYRQVSLLNPTYSETPEFWGRFFLVAIRQGRDGLAVRTARAVNAAIKASPAAERHSITFDMRDRAGVLSVVTEIMDLGTPAALESPTISTLVEY